PPPAHAEWKDERLARPSGDRGSTDRPHGLSGRLLGPCGIGGRSVGRLVGPPRTQALDDKEVVDRLVALLVLVDNFRSGVEVFNGSVDPGQEGPQLIRDLARARGRRSDDLLGSGPSSSKHLVGFGLGLFSSVPRL